MRHYLLLFLFGLLQFSCGSSSETPESIKSVIFKTCREEPKVYDSKTEINGLKNLFGLSYSYTYNSISTSRDSIHEEKIRRVNAKIGQLVVKELFPQIEILSDSIWQSKKYSEVHVNTAQIYWNLPDKLWSKVNGKNAPRYGVKPSTRDLTNRIKNLIIPTTKDKQLFVEVRTYQIGRKLKNLITVFVFNTKVNTLLYYDKVEYYCDIADPIAFSKVLNYSLEKLKANTLTD